MKISFHTFILCFMGLALATTGQGQDSLVYYQEISFHSEFEILAFEDFFRNKEQNYLNLFLATSPNADQQSNKRYAQIYNDQLGQIKQQKQPKKNNEKRIKNIHQEVHKRFLRKYEAQNTMQSVFVDGSYNCVTASALYAIVFEALDIPYTIKVKPTHVYVVAYPEKESVLVESTDPSSGIVSFSHSFKRDYVDQMARAKIISQKEMDHLAVEELFNKYFFSDEDINLKQLVGLQYINEALYLLGSKDKINGLKMLEKAYFFYPADKLKTLLLAINAEILVSSNYEDLSLADNFIKLSRFKEYGITNNDMLAEFSRISDIHLINNNDTAQFDLFYRQIAEGLQDLELIEELSFVYNYERGRTFYNLGLYKRSLPFFENAYKIKPQNVDITRLFINTIALKLENEANIDRTIYELEQYKKRLPDLVNHNVFKSYLANSYLIQFGRAYQLKDEEKGLKFQGLFEQYYDENLNINKTNVGRAYSLAAVYYFRKGYNNKARAILNKGLKIAPGNHELATRKRLIQ